jgi:hypothetical protein
MESLINLPVAHSYKVDVAEGRSKFARFVDYTVERYCQKNTPILKFWLAVTLVDGSLVSSVRRWVSMAMSSGVRELYLEMKPGFSRSPFVLAHSP